MCIISPPLTNNSLISGIRAVRMLTSSLPITLRIRLRMCWTSYSSPRSNPPKNSLSASAIAENGSLYWNWSYFPLRNISDTPSFSNWCRSIRSSTNLDTSELFPTPKCQSIKQIGMWWSTAAVVGSFPHICWKTPFKTSSSSTLPQNWEELKFRFDFRSSSLLYPS